MGKYLAHQPGCCWVHQLRTCLQAVRYLRDKLAVRCMVRRQKGSSMKLILCLTATWPFQCGLLKRALSCRQYMLAAQRAVRVVKDIAGATSWQEISGRKCSWLPVREVCIMRHDALLKQGIQSSCNGRCCWYKCSDRCCRSVTVVLTV